MLVSDKAEKRTYFDKKRLQLAIKKAVRGVECDRD